jgi:hypothetical protein
MNEEFACSSASSVVICCSRCGLTALFVSFCDSLRPLSHEPLTFHNMESLRR